MGIGATRALDRVSASLGLMREAEPLFEHGDNVCNAGVLFLIPALVSQGLLKGAEIYGTLKKGYYGLVTILLLLCFMYLNRIKTPEQLKTCKPGELGKLLGLDRVPEVRCLREKLSRIKAHFFNIVEENLDKSIDVIKEEIESQSRLQEGIKGLETQIAACIEERKKIGRHIGIHEMESGIRYNKLKDRKSVV